MHSIHRWLLSPRARHVERLGVRRPSCDKGTTFTSATIMSGSSRSAPSTGSGSSNARDEILLWTYLALPCIVPLGMEINKDLIAASSTPLVLAILAEGDSYGYAILKRVRELSGGDLAWTDGMLYPVLHRLERLGFIEARWETADSGRRRRYYRLTSRGRTQLAEERKQWQAVDATLRGIWKMLALRVPANQPARVVPLPQGA